MSGPHNTYLEGCDEAKAFARRLTWWLNGEGVSVGSNYVVDVHLDTALAPNTVQVGPVGRGADDWQTREVTVGVEPDSSPADADRIAIAAITLGVRALVPDHAPRVDEAAHIVGESGERCRFLHRAKETTKEIVEVTSTIAARPHPSHVFIAVTDKATGLYRESPPIAVTVWDDAVYLAGKIRRTRTGVAIDARNGYPAQLVAAATGPLEWTIDELVPTERPLTSSLLVWR
ncbi:hypothetical protein [Microbacterium dextranolyticum]|uniref:Uncharacterized protein n=1 Tax=Microbacterium dextranolyticum TaxID=36806 RepID=A0A9W6M5L5_9MICO|nr:hypothetical protein [Microbacterium dextranolyticum]MBM7462358.1 hypothetical protein [Microbacterium dextranolyticum]GLJ94608.1 hypothetical protein GCM10017591_06690 [Microbacterium dextranolyticum]